jgi:hypothetical protein
VLERRDDPVHRLDGREDVVVGEDHALRGAGRPGREDQLDDVAGLGRRPGIKLGLPIGREAGVRLGRQVRDQRRGEGLETGIRRARGVTAAAN